jgi:hypothetical protein
VHTAVCCIACSSCRVYLAAASCTNAPAVAAQAGAGLCKAQQQQRCWDSKQGYMAAKPHQRSTIRAAQVTARLLVSCNASCHAAMTPRREALQAAAAVAAAGTGQWVTHFELQSQCRRLHSLTQTMFVRPSRKLPEQCTCWAGNCRADLILKAYVQERLNACML